MPAVEWRKYTHSKRSETWHWLTETPMCRVRRITGLGGEETVLVFRTRCKKEWEESELRAIPIGANQYECTACARARKDEEAAALRKAVEEIRSPKSATIPEGAEYGDVAALLVEIGLRGGVVKQIDARRKMWNDHTAPLYGTVLYWTAEQVQLFEEERREKERANAN